ncbi:DUF616 domain-containing protein [Hyphomonas sp. FCG-A18]|uniref:glycosyltransferase domain-containing protein n=1 Tax=Hyphomonas sp. FCG-A18 TaxID=3080019 RepID=UPI002B2F4CCA|nr:DUF616 domain-containing protein [Hyphomonas sp. FCG-A18]
MPDASQLDVLLICGSHRSGTSALTRTFNLLGYGAPRTLIKSNKSNRSGHWESEPLARLNDSLLQKGGLTWDAWGKGHLDRLRVQDRRDFIEDLHSLLASEFPPGQPWVVKCPRICRLLPYYLEAFEQKEASLKIVIPVRNPLEVMKSLEVRNGMSQAAAGLLWLRYMLETVEASANVPRTFMAYEDFLDDPVLLMGKIVDQLDLDPPFPIDGVADQIAAFADTGLRHHQRTPIEVAHDPVTEVWISDAYAALLLLCKEPTTKEALERLAQIKAKLDAADPILGTIAGALEAEADEHRVEFERRLKLVQDSLTEAHSQVEIQTKQLSDYSTKLDLAETEAAAARSETLDLSKLREADAEELKKIRQELAELRKTPKLSAEATKAMKEAKDLQDRLKATEKELRQQSRQFWRLKDELSWSKGMIRQYEASTSWRVTRPLRTIMRSIRGLRTPNTQSELPPPAKDLKSDHAVEATKKTAKSGTYNKSDIATLVASKAFDKTYYLSHYPESQLHPEGPEAHYLESGWRKGFKPNPTFDTKAYLAAHPDLKTVDTCPLLHFIKTEESAVKANAKKALNGSGRAPRIAVFTAIVDGYDDLKEPEIISEHADYFVFTNSKVSKNSVWKPMPLEYVSHDPTRTARFVKTHPHLYFADYDWAIWVDANLLLVEKPEALLPDPGSKSKVLTWHHPLRNCVYQEGDECIKRGKDDADIISQHMERLRARDYPVEAGMFETSVMVSRMGDRDVEGMFKQWWADIARWSRRDQLSLPVVLNGLDLDVGYLARAGICMRTDPRFVYFGHNK